MAIKAEPKKLSIREGRTHVYYSRNNDIAIPISEFIREINLLNNHQASQLSHVIDSTFSPAN